MKPLIGVSCNFVEKEGGAGDCVVGAPYVDAVRIAGGLPAILPPLDRAEDAQELLGRLEGVVFIGGADLRPQRYGEEMHPMTKLVSERREKADFLYLDAAMRRDMPTMAICYGCQALNVAFGGSLYQDIPMQIKTGVLHAGTGARHGVRVERGTKLWGILKRDEIETNSFHHQAVKAVKEPMVVSARASDGVVEAIESTRHRLMLGIQWHPERMVDKEEHLMLFQALVEEARRR